MSSFGNRNMSLAIMVTLAFLVQLATSVGVAAQSKLVFVTPPNSIDTVVSEVITHKAYKRIGITVQI